MLQVIFILIAEELEATITARVDTTESHVNAVTEPRVEAVHWVDQVDRRGLAPRLQRQLETVLFRNEGDEIIEISEAGRLECHGKSQAHTRCYITSFVRGVLDAAHCEHFSRWWDEFYALRHHCGVGHLHADLVDAIDLIFDEAHISGLDSERGSLLHLLNLIGFFACRGHQDRCLVHLVAWVLQVADLLIHAVNDLKVSLLLALIQTLQIGRFAGALLRGQKALVCRGIGRCV